MKNIVILGHGVGVKFVIESLIKSNTNYRVVALVTHPKKEHEHDRNLMNRRKKIFGDYAYNVFDLESDHKIKILELGRLCDSLSYRKTLERGYVIVRDYNKRIIDHSKDAVKAKNIVLEFKDNDLKVEVEGKHQIKP